MTTTRLSSKGQLILPKEVRQAHGWRAGVEFVVEDLGDAILLRPARPFPEMRVEEVRGCTGYQGPRRSLEEMVAAIAKGAGEGT